MNELLDSITKDELNLLPVETFAGHIVVVDTLEELDKVISILNQQEVIGFDTETKPVFTKGKRNKVALLQIATSTTCYLIRLNQIGFPVGLTDFFNNKHVLKVGLSIKDDFLMLRGRDHALEPQGFIELQSFVKDYGIADNSLQKIYAILFGKKLSKAQRLSNWEADELSHGQQAYAALDAIACRQIYLELKQKYPLKPLETTPKPIQVEPE
ncbi:MAG TPA: 3'-5' exonuclease [Bacteroidales bacterium]|nr:3'-5' exonuclease [Bacteroidales bacterium]